MFVHVDPESPEPWLIVKVADALRKGGVAVLPTDTIYGLACSVSQPDAIGRLYAIKGLDPKKPLSILLPDVNEVGHWARAVSTPSYRLMRRVLPGPYTFILHASPDVPRVMLRARKTIGVRVPDCPIVLAILRDLGEPLITTSVPANGNKFENDPFELEERLGRLVDVVVDGGPLSYEPSTIVDLTGDAPLLVRAGKGDVEVLHLLEA